MTGEDQDGPPDGDRVARASRELVAVARRMRRDSRPILIVVPVYNDWAAFRELARTTDEVCARAGVSAEMLVVDDGSWQDPSSVLDELAAGGLTIGIGVARLATNVGHQRAIATGLVLAHERAREFTAVLVMDGDGEDRPEHIPELLRESAAYPEAIVCARRGKRFEGVRFALGYGLFKAAFTLCTGRRIDFGHYCVIPPALLGRLVHSPSLWSHFAATVLRSGVPLRRIHVDRGRRYAGRSTMNLTSLIRHGLNAIAVFEDVWLIRMLVGLGLFSGLVVSALVGVGVVKLGTDLAIPGWTTSAAGLLLVILLQAALLAVMSVTAHLSRRSLPEFIPALDAKRFIVRSEQASETGGPAWKAAS